MPKRLHPLTPAQRLRILKRDNYTCQYCFGEAVEVDHVVPHSHDADNSDLNLVASCIECNRLAYNFHFESFNQKYLYLKRRRAQRGDQGNAEEWHAKAVRAIIDEAAKLPKVAKPVKVKVIKPPKPKVIKPPKVKDGQMNLLKQVYEEIYGPIGGPNKQKNLATLSKRMALLIGREPWSYRALNGAMNEQRGFTITHEMETALQMIVAQLDNANPLQAHLVEITAYSINGNVAPGSIITGHSTRCPGCLVLFVPHHNLQVYCGKECPGRPRRKPTPRPRSPD